jgi:hypothetical protein
MDETIKDKCRKEWNIRRGITNFGQMKEGKWMTG